MEKRKLQEIKIGDSASVSKIITEADVLAYAKVTGDFNPQHVDKEFGKASMFKQRIAHGMLGVGLISRVLGTDLPGIGSIYLGQEVKFLAPVYFEDEITAIVEVLSISEKKVIKLKTTCLNQNKTIVIDGTAYIKLPNK